MAGRGVPLATISRIRDCAQRRLCQITLGDLFHYQGRLQHVSEPPSFVQLASVLQDEIPVRFAHQLIEYYRLPYFAWKCEPFRTVHDRHLRAFEALSSFKKITTEEDVADFTECLRLHLADTDSMGSFRSGLGELQRLGFSEEDLQPLHPFLDKFIVTRIGNQVLANHFLDWFDREQLTHKANENVISECLLAPYLLPSIKQVCDLALRIYGVRPVVNIEAARDTKVLVVPSHIQFIFREVLKNSVHATMKQHTESGRVSAPPPVQVSIRPGKFDVDLRVSDQGGGMSRKTLKKIWEYGFSGSPSPWPVMAVDHDSDDGPELSTIEDKKRRLGLQMSGYGMGIPLGRHYSRFFGGDLHFSSIYGFGTDASITINRLFSIEERENADLVSSVSEPLDRVADGPSIFDFELGSGRSDE